MDDLLKGGGPSQNFERKNYFRAPYVEDRCIDGIFTTNSLSIRQDPDQEGSVTNTDLVIKMNRIRIWIRKNAEKTHASWRQCCGSVPTLFRFGSGPWFSCSFRSGSFSGSEQDPNKFGSGSDLNLSNFFL